MEGDKFRRVTFEMQANMNAQHSHSGNQGALDTLAQRYGFSLQAVTVMWDAVTRGDGTLAQFSHPEFGGAGQWMQGGMIMLGDMFNNQLKSRVDSLCSEIAGMLALQPATARVMQSGQQQGHWWPEGLSDPNIVGGQDALRYAYFSAAHRLVIDDHGHIVVYDTRDHVIAGVSQQQSATSSLSFTSQHGVLDLSSLPVVD